MEKTSLQIEQDMLDDLDKLAEVRGMKRSQVMRKGLAVYIKDCKNKGEIK